jgi:hypothetical protein
VFLQHEGRHLQRLRQVARKSSVVLARHDSVEAAAQRESALGAELADNGLGRELAVRIQAEGDRSGSEWWGEWRWRWIVAAPRPCRRFALAGWHRAILG